jgi:HSP20 family molecular chaperone IbpA
MSMRKRRSVFEIMGEYFESVEEDMERLGEMLMERPSWNCRACTMEPLRNIMIAPNEVTVTVDLPFTEEKAIQVKPIDKNAIEISAKMRRKIRFDDFGITHYRGEFQRFHSRIHVPVPVRMEKMKTRVKKGILEIRIPRKNE